MGSLRQVGKDLRQHLSWRNLNPFNWSVSEIKWFLGSFFAVMLPVFFFIGLQPIPVDAASLPQLQMPSIELETPVATIELVDRQLEAPATIAGVYSQAENKLFIIGHSSTVFKNLHKLQINDTFTYDSKTYLVKQIETLAKPDISMNQILQAEAQETIVIMTCAGDPLPNQDATHRLIVTATLVD